MISNGPLALLSITINTIVRMPHLMKGTCCHNQQPLLHLNKYSDYLGFTSRFVSPPPPATACHPKPPSIHRFLFFCSLFRFVAAILFLAESVRHPKKKKYLYLRSNLQLLIVMSRTFETSREHLVRMPESR